MSTTPLSQNGVANPPVESSQIPPTPQDGEKEKQASNNPFIRKLKPEYIRTPFPLDFANNMRSDVFCYAKVVRSIIKPMGLTDKKEYMWFIEQAWKYFEEEDQREADEQAIEMMEDITQNQRLFDAFRRQWNIAMSNAKTA
jgi:hypothetical protein